MSKYIPKGPYGVVLTPFKEDGSIDIGALREEVEFVSQSKITGLFPCATTGEFIHLSPNENMLVMEEVTKQANGRKEITPGVSASNIDTAFSYCKKAYELGCDSVVICSPYYITMPQTEIKEFLKRFAKKVDYINIILYNIPMFTSEIAIDTVSELMEIDHIVGIKDSGQNMKRISHLVDIAKRKRPDFSVMVGTDDMLVPALTCGCVGSMTAMSTIFPEINTEIYRLFDNNEITKAMELNRSYLKLIRLADSITFPAGYKLVMEKRGFEMGNKQVVSIENTEKYDILASEIENEVKKLEEDCAKMIVG